MFKLNMETGGSAFCHPYTGEEDEWYEAREIASTAKIKYLLY